MLDAHLAQKGVRPVARSYVSFHGHSARFGARVPVPQSENDEEDGEESEEQINRKDHVRYFHEDEDNTKPRVGCAFEEPCVRVEGKARYALVSPTDKTGDVIVCAAACLVPCDPD